MKNNRLHKIYIGLFAGALLAGCSDDDKDEIPVVSVAATAQVKESRSLTLTATGQDDKEELSYSWAQVSGPTLALTDVSTASVGITAPAVSADSTAVLRVTVTDSANQTATADVTVTVANNLLPELAASFATVTEKSGAELSVTAQDQDGEISSYSWTQTGGPTVELAGAGTGTVTFTAPSVTENTVLTFSVTVTDDDNESTTLSQDVTITQQLNSYTLSGVIAEEAFANSAVTAVLAGQSFSATTDETGSFNLSITADDDETNLFTSVTASSEAMDGVEYYTFIHQLDADTAEPAAASMVDQLINLVYANAENAVPNTVSINAMSTALYSLIVQANNNEVPTDLDAFTVVEKSVSPDELIEAAAVVKLVTQGGDFALPEGISNVLELLTNTEAYNNYVATAEASVPGIVTATVNEIIADPELTAPVDADSLASVYFEVSPAAAGFLSRGGDKYDFKADGSGSESYGHGVNRFNWSINDGKVQLTYLESMGTAYYPDVAVGVAGLTEEQVAYLLDNGINYVEVIQVPTMATMQRIVKGELTDTYRVVTHGIETMTPLTIYNVLINPEGVSYSSSSDQLLRNGDKLQTQNLSAADMVGQWAFDRYYYAGDDGLGYADMLFDIFDINTDGTGTALEKNVPFTWEINAKGAFVADLDDGTSLEVVKLDQVGNDIQVFTSAYDIDGNLIAVDLDYAVKLDGSDFSDFEQINTEDMYWQGTINLWAKDAWHDGTLLWDNGLVYFGFQFREDGQGYTMALSSSNPPEFTPEFNTGFSWTKDSMSGAKQHLEIHRRMCADDPQQSCSRRDWKLLKVEDGILGKRIYVLESQVYRQNSTSPEYIVYGLGPRLNFYEEMSFDYWNQTAQPTDSAVTDRLNLPAGSLTPNKRLLLEPNKVVKSQH